MKEATSEELLNALKYILEHPKCACFIHYACTDIYKYQRLWRPPHNVPPDQTPSPKVNAIAVYHLDNDETRYFGIDFYLKTMGLLKYPDDNRRDELEAVMLDSFNRYLSQLDKDIIYINWNMESCIFGFDALTRRYRILGVEPHGIRPEYTLNLADVIAMIFPSKTRHIRLMSLLRTNGLNEKSIMDGFYEGLNYSDLEQVSMSTVAKTKAIAELLILTAKEKLKFPPD